LAGKVQKSLVNLEDRIANISLSAYDQIVFTGKTSANGLAGIGFYAKNDATLTVKLDGP
jgi:hypothetical protein